MQTRRAGGEFGANEARGGGIGALTRRTGGGGVGTHETGIPHTSPCMHKAVCTQGGAHKRRSVATAGVLLFKGPWARR